MTEFKEGDIVRYIGRKIKVEAPLVASGYRFDGYGGKPLYPQGFPNLPYTDRAGEHGWTVEMVEPLLVEPTEPGIYTNATGNYYQLLSSGGWRYLGSDLSYENLPLNFRDIINNDTLKRLVPEE